MRIRTADLLHKWGLEDGHILDSILVHLGYDLMVVNTNPILVALVKDHVLPMIQQTLVFEVRNTHHNPIRITHVDGVEVDNYRDEHPENRLLPEFVDIPEAVISEYTDRWLAEDRPEKRQAALVQHIRGLWYPRHSGAWLKVVPLEDVLDRPLCAALVAAGSDPHARLAVQHQILSVFLEDHYGDLAGESSRWGEFNDGSWRPVAGDELHRCIDAVLDQAAARVAEDHKDAEAGDYLDYHRKTVSGLMIDFRALREWFTSTLWAGVEPNCWTLEPDEDGDVVPAVIGVSDELVAILWLP